MKIFVNSRSPPANSAFAFYPNKKRKENTLVCLARNLNEEVTFGIVSAM